MVHSPAMVGPGDGKGARCSRPAKAAPAATAAPAAHPPRPNVADTRQELLELVKRKAEITVRIRL